MGAGKGSGSFILPGLQKLRRICNTSDSQPDDVGQAQDKDKEKDKKEGVGRGKGYGIGKKEVKKDRQQELEYGDCETEDLSESRNVELEHLESERERVHGVSIKAEPSTHILSCAVEVEMSESIKHHKGIPNSDSSMASTDGRGLTGDENKDGDGDGDKGRESDRHGRCYNDNLELESQLIVKEEMDIDKRGEAIQLHTRHEKEEQVDVKGNGEVKGDVDEDVVVNEGGLSVSLNGRIEFIAPCVFKSIPRPAINPSLSHQKSLATNGLSNASIESVNNTVMAPLHSIPKGPGDGPRGWVVPTKKKVLLPVTATATATATTATVVVPFKVPSGLVKRSENDVAGKIEILKVTAQRVVVVKRLHGIDSKHLIAPVPMPAEVTAESLLAGSGKLQVSSTSSSLTHYLLTQSLASFFYLLSHHIISCCASPILSCTIL